MRGGSLALSIALAGMLVLSGCAGKSASSSTTSADSTGSSSAPASSGAGNASAASANHAPVLNSFKANTTGPVVKFTFNATDADKDALSFTLVFGDKTANGTGSLPKGNVTHTYAAKGNYTAKLTVSDGKLSVNRTLVLALTGAATVLGPEQTFTCTVKVGTYTPAGGLREAGSGIGQCDYVTLDTDAIVTASAPASSCRNMEDGAAVLVVGQTYKSGALLVMKCDAGALNADGSLTIRAT